MGFPGGLVVKESALNAGDPGSIPGLDFTVFNPKYITVDSSGMRQKVSCSGTKETFLKENRECPPFLEHTAC